MTTRVVGGLDVHRSIIAGSLLKPGGQIEHQRFATNVAELRKLRGWLEENQCEVVGMEATGVYWKPIHRELEKGMEVIVANPQHIKAIKGRKTDKADAEWIARKVADDAISPSFIPAPEVRETRDLARYRQNVVKNQTQIKNQIHKLLSGAGVPLSSTLEDLFGVSGMAILKRLKDGESAWTGLEGLLKGEAKKKAEAIRLALEMPLTEAQRWELAAQLDRLAKTQEDLKQANNALESRLPDYAAIRARLVAIPGIAHEGAGLLLAHMGPDLSAFPDADHFAAWIGLCPGNNESGGKKGKAPTRKGNHYLRGLFTQFAHGAIRTKGSWLQHKYRSLMGRMIYQKAIIAIAHKLAIIVFKVIKDGVDYKDRAEEYVPSKDKKRSLRKAIAFIESRGGHVTFPTPKPEKASPELLPLAPAATGQTTKAPMTDEQQTPQRLTRQATRASGVGLKKARGLAQTPRRCREVVTG